MRRTPLARLKNASLMTTLMAAQVLCIPRKCSICHIRAVAVWVLFLVCFALENSSKCTNSHARICSSKCTQRVICRWQVGRPLRCGPSAGGLEDENIVAQKAAACRNKAKSRRDNAGRRASPAKKAECPSDRNRMSRPVQRMIRPVAGINSISECSFRRRARCNLRLLLCHRAFMLRV
jgi:hypothetical protein